MEKKTGKLLIIGFGSIRVQYTLLLYMFEIFHSLKSIKILNLKKIDVRLEVKEVRKGGRAGERVRGGKKGFQGSVFKLNHFSSTSINLHFFKLKYAYLTSTRSFGL